jgi:type II secretory pathway component PulF
MIRFNYTAKNKKAEVVRDTIEADSRQQALTQLRELELTVVSLTAMDADVRSHPDKGAALPLEKQKLPSTPFWKKDLFSHSKKVKSSDMAIFCRQLSISVNSGLPLRDALAGIHEDMDSPAFKDILDQVLVRLHNGIPFSKAVEEHPKVFSSVFVGLVRAAEESGSMGETMSKLADYLESSDRLRRKVASLMAYPIFVAGFFVLICGVMVFWIVPQFQDIFGGLNAELPKMTRAVFAVNNTIVTKAPLIGGIILLLVVLFVLYRRSSGGKLQLAKIQLKLPWVGECITQYVIARVCRCLAIMLKSGVPIATGLQIVAKVGNNQVIQNSLIEARTQTVGGGNIADSLAGTKIFPSLLIRMVKVGESAGRLPEVLDNVAAAYEDRVENTITTGMALLEPIIIVIFGALVLILVISIYLPVMTVSSNI